MSNQIGLVSMNSIIWWVTLRNFRGGAPLEFMRAGTPWEQAVSQYKRLAGEVSARDAQHRLLKLSEKQRQMKSSPSTQEIPWDQQIIRYYPDDY
jgi:hypothetical protein